MHLLLKYSNNDALNIPTPSPPTRWLFYARLFLGEPLTSTNPTVASIVERMDANLKEAFEERAAIMEFDGGLNREHAECLALLEIIKRHPVQILNYLI